LKVVYTYNAGYQAPQMNLSKMWCKDAANLQKEKLFFRTMWLVMHWVRIVPKN